MLSGRLKWSGKCFKSIGTWQPVFACLFSSSFRTVWALVEWIGERELAFLWAGDLNNTHKQRRAQMNKWKPPSLLLVHLYIAILEHSSGQQLHPIIMMRHYDGPFFHYDLSVFSLVPYFHLLLKQKINVSLLVSSLSQIIACQSYNCSQLKWVQSNKTVHRLHCTSPVCLLKWSIFGLEMNGHYVKYDNQSFIPLDPLSTGKRWCLIEDVQATWV